MWICSWLSTLMSDHVFDHEFAPQQSARIVRYAPQPLFLRELLFAGGQVGGDRSRRLARGGIAQRRFRIASRLRGFVGLCGVAVRRGVAGLSGRRGLRASTLLCTLRLLRILLRAAAVLVLRRIALLRSAGILPARALPGGTLLRR